MTLSASLVLYNNAPELYVSAIGSFLKATDEAILTVVDNSPQPLQHPIFQHRRVRRLFSGKNLGFGAGHNLALASVPASLFHLILNPDVQFSEGVIGHLVRVLDSSANIGAIMPRINYPDGSQQHLCKLLPTPADLILRRFIPILSIQSRLNSRYELHDLPTDGLQDVPTVSGCFLLVRTELLKRLGGFDERYFMYMEDVDLIRRVGDTHRVVFEPSVAIVHGYGKGSYRSSRLLSYHMRSAIKYFFKWGWFLDLERLRRNRAVLRRIRQCEAQQHDLPKSVVRPR